MSMKNPLTPAGIEPATFRFVTQHLSHCATAVTWAISKEDKSRITSGEMKFRKRTAKCTRWDYILSEHKIKPVLKKIQNYINTIKLT